MIIVSFENQDLHDICVDLQRAESTFGTVHAAALVTFISDVVAFENANELIDFLGGSVKIASDDSLVVSIGSDLKAALVAVGQRFECDEGGRIRWTTVQRLKLAEITRVP